MKKVEKKVKPIENSLNPYASLSALDKLKLNQEVRPELSVTLKLEVARAPVKDRSHVQDVAEVLEEILTAADKGLNVLPPRLNRLPGQIWNDAKQKKEDDQRREKDIKVSKEDKRKKRDEKVKNELVKLKEIKEKEEEEKKKKAEIDAKAKAEAKVKQEEAIKKRLATMRVIGADDPKIKAAQEELKKKRLEEEMAKNRKNVQEGDPEQKKSERKEFMKKQKEKIKQSFEMMIKEREDLV